MSKEMVVSASPHETRVAILEDGQVAEVFFEREHSYSLAGSIYKGRVTRILPGMQSAFVNIGLERDAFLYVSDFLEGIEEYDQLLNTLEERTPPTGLRDAEETVEPARSAAEDDSAAASVEPPEPSAESSAAAIPDAPPSSNQISVPQGAAQPSDPEANKPQQRYQPPGRGRDGGRPGGRDRGGRFSRRGRRGSQGFPDSKYARSGAEQGPRPETSSPSAPPEPPSERILLPGESLAKYRDATRPSEAAASEPPVNLSLGAIPSGMETTEPSAAPISEVMPMQATAQAAEALARADAVMEEILEEEAEIMASPPLAEDVSAVNPETAAVEAEEREAGEFIAFAGTSSASVNEPDSQAAVKRAADAGIEWESREQTPEASGEMPGEVEPEELSASPEDASEDDEAGAGAGEESARQDGVAGVAGEAGTPREAAVREGGRNARFQRRQRWQSGRGGKPQEGRREPGRRPPTRSAPRSAPREGAAPRPLIGDMLKEGQEIIVQIAKEPLGKKGARITSHVALPGRYVVYMPTLNHVGVSRKVSSDEERQRLKRIVLDAAKNFAGGFIVRTAGDGRSEEDIRQDVQFLTRLWTEVKAKAEKSSAPSLLHHDPDLVLRTLRDQLSPEFTTIWVDNEQVYEQILLMVQKFQPALVGRVRLYTKDVPLFEETGVQEELNKALKPKVWLKSGGYIVINQTEALVAIDINTGKFVGKSNRLEDTIVKTNIEAIQEIVRQIRLRDLGGIIVIDFIDMDERKNRARVMAELEEAVKADRSPSKILSFNEFGLVAITRKRVRQSLERSLCLPCAYCDGAGMVKSPATVSLEILTEAKKIAGDLGGKQITIRVNPEVGKTLKSTGASILESIEELTGKGVIIRNDPSVHMENFYFD